MLNLSFSFLVFLISLSLFADRSNETKASNAPSKIEDRQAVHVDSLLTPITGDESKNKTRGVKLTKKIESKLMALANSEKVFQRFPEVIKSVNDGKNRLTDGTVLTTSNKKGMSSGGADEISNQYLQIENGNQKVVVAQDLSDGKKMLQIREFSSTSELARGGLDLREDGKVLGLGRTLPEHRDKVGVSTEEASKNTWVSVKGFKEYLKIQDQLLNGGRNLSAFEKAFPATKN